MARIALLQADLRAAARIKGALSDAHELIPCSSWAEVASLVQSDQVGACFVDGEYPPANKALWWIRKIRTEAPLVVLIIATESRDSEHVFTLGRLDADGLVLVGSDPWAIRLQISAAMQRGRARLLRQRLGGSWPPVGCEALARAVEMAGQSYSADQLAVELGFESVPRLRRALRSHHLPSPSRILLWGRLLTAACMLKMDEGRPDAVAHYVGYSASSGLARAMTRATGMTLSEVAEGAGMPDLLPALLETERGRSGGRRDLSARRPRLMVAALLAALAGCASGGVDRSRISDILTSPPVDQYHMGVLAVDAASGDTLYARNHRKKFIPASNQKILVTAAALSLLGPDFRYPTRLWAVGTQSDSVLEGDLVLVPSGDPTISGRYGRDGTAELEGMVDQLAATGIRRVTGSLLIDASAWDSTTVTPTWEVEDLRYRYGATGSVFAIDEGEIEVVVRGGSSAGAPAQVHWSPGAEDYLRPRVLTDVEGTRRSIQATYLPESRRIVIEGVIAPGATDTLRIAQRDPAGVAGATLSAAITRAGIQVDGEREALWDDTVLVGDGCMTGAIAVCPSATMVAERVSPPLIEITAEILAPSQNWMTEQLIRTLGATLGERGGWTEGIEVMERWLIHEAGVDSTDVYARDGSGMSFYNLVTPRALVRILQTVRGTPYAQQYRLAMAEPGEAESTLEDRLPELSGRVFAKTGTISNVNSLSGYLVGSDGQEIIFSIVANATGLPANRVRASVDEIVRALAR